MKKYGRYTAEEILKGFILENGIEILNVNILSIEAAKDIQLYGVSNTERQVMALDIDTNTDMANGFEDEVSGV